MSELALPARKPLPVWTIPAMILGLLALIAVVAIPNLQRSRYASMSANFAGNRAELMAASDKNDAATAFANRKLTYTTSFELIVANPKEAAEKARLLAEGMGGYLESSQTSGNQNAPAASVDLRIPAEHLEAARIEIRKLAAEVETERTESTDVTKQYVDLEADLRSLRAQEAQYLQILKSATKVPDMVVVTEKLNEVRGKIEQQQAEFTTLSRQVEMAALSISMRGQDETQVFGLHWRPLYQFKLAARNGLDSLGDFAAFLTAALFMLPSLLLWAATIAVVLALAVRILRWAARTFFGFLKPAVTEKVVG